MYFFRSTSDHLRNDPIFGAAMAIVMNCPGNLKHIFIVVPRAFMAGAAIQAGYADSSRAPGLTSGLQGSVNIHRGALLFVLQ